MFLLTGIDTRASASRLVDPGPGRDEIRRILAAAVRAPDHGRLEPWRFRVLQGEARQRLAAALADFTRRTNPAATPEQLAAAANKALRAPIIIVVSAHITRGHKVPEIEQVIAVGAAVQNMLLAAHALAIGAMWRTGAPAYDAGVKRALGIEPEDHIVAFVYLGTPQGASPARSVRFDELVTWDQEERASC